MDAGGAVALKAERLAALHARLASEGWQAVRDEVLEYCPHLLTHGYARDVLDLLRFAVPSDSLEVVQLKARALSNTGAPGAAASLLEACIDQGYRDAETLGLLGRAKKDLARRASTQDVAGVYWREAFESYRSAFTDSQSTYVGINAATLALKLERSAEAVEFAQRVLALCRASAQAEHWNQATIGEAQLVLGDLEGARAAYKNAVKLAGSRIVSVGSMLRQAREVLALKRIPFDALDDIFQMPKVAVFTGHRLLHPESGDARFSAKALAKLGFALQTLITQEHIGFGYAAAADGADIVFLEQLLKLGLEVHLVLPVDLPVFREQCVSPLDGWRERFDVLVNGASSVTIASDGLAHIDQAALRYANEIALGQARIRADELCSEVVGLSVWDRRPGPPGGTADCIRAWHKAGVACVNVDPHTLVATRSAEPTASTGSTSRQVVAMVFADIVGFSTFTEQEIAAYFRDIQTLIAERSESNGREPLVRQSFGDALYLVYGNIEEAADFALTVQSLFDRGLHVDGSEAPLRIRIAVHAGPLTQVVDAVTGKPSFTGRHASRAARVEPVSGENQVLATQQFAALLAVRGPDRYELVYAGERMLPKNFGTERLYSVHAAAYSQSLQTGV